MKFEFLNLEPTIGQATLPSYEELKFFSLDMEKEFGLATFTPNALNELK